MWPRKFFTWFMYSIFNYHYNNCFIWGTSNSSFNHEVHVLMMAHWARAVHISNIQYSVDISKLCIHVLNSVCDVHIFLIRLIVYLYAHIYVYTHLDVSLLFIPISFFTWSIIVQTKSISGTKKHQVSKLMYIHRSCTYLINFLGSSCNRIKDFS